MIPLFGLDDPEPVDGVNSGGGVGFGNGCRFLVLPAGLTAIGGGVVLAVVLTELNGLRVPLPVPDEPPVAVVVIDPGAFVTGTLTTGLVGAMPVVGMTKVLTTVVVIELNMSVVVVTVVEPPSPDASDGAILVGSAAVPNMVREPIMVDTKVLGGMTVVSTDVIVRGASLV